jgi:hypothetical protein
MTQITSTDSALSDSYTGAWQYFAEIVDIQNE